MENRSAFDLKKSIYDWRCTLRGVSAMDVQAVDELESHLHETMVSLRSAGLSDEESFWIATRRVGSPCELREQFDCAKPYGVWRERGLWMILGVAILWTITSLGNVAALGALLMGRQWTGSGALLGFWGLGIEALVFIVPIVWAWRKLTSPQSAARIDGPSVQRVVLWFFIAAIALRSFEVVLLLTAVRLSTPSLLGGFHLVTARMSALLVVLLIGAAALFLVRPFRKSGFGRVAIFLLSFFIAGCNPSSDAPRLSVPAATDTSTSTAFESVVETSTSQPAEAMKAILQLDVVKAPLFSKESPLSYSEADFLKLPPAVNEKLALQAQKEIQALKMFIAEIRKQRDQARAAGDSALANQVSAQLEKLGARMQGRENLALSQVVGKAIVMVSKE